MWDIQFEEHELYKVLTCTPSQDNPQGISAIRIYNWKEDRIQLNIQTNSDQYIIDDLTYRIHNLAPALLANVSFSAPAHLTFDCSVKLTEDLQSLILVLNTLDDRIHYFSEITQALQLILKPNKASIILAHKNHMQGAVPKFESQGENTMRASLRATTRTSEIALRAKYNFEAPMYSLFFNAPSPASTPQLPAEEDEEDEEDFDDNALEMQLGQFVGLQHGNQLATQVNTMPVEALDDFDNTTEYSEQENSLIASLIKFVSSQQAYFLRRGFLVTEASGRIILSQKSYEILNSDIEDVSANDLSTATKALNIKTCVRALNPQGSHSHNREMYRTGIVGYGMRNITALMWHCCLEAKKNNSFMVGVTFNDACNAMINGIANGARAGNREDEFGDDLSEKDMPPCDAGKYNSIISAFNGIFAEVNIIYNYIEFLLQELKREIIHILVDNTQNYAIAHQFLNLWLSNDGKDTPNEYLHFVEHVKAEFPNMITRILDLTSPYDPILKEQISDDIKIEIKQVEDINFGLKFIEIVSPSVSDLDTAWQHRFPQDNSPAEYAAAIATQKKNASNRPKADNNRRTRQKLTI